LSPIARRVAGYLKKQDVKGRILCDMDFYFKRQVYAKVRPDFLNTYSLIPSDHPDRTRFSAILTTMLANKNFDPAPLGLSVAEGRGTAAVLGMAVADALGAST
jgi:hypothetical protein